jgi:hypothetical protein
MDITAAIDVAAGLVLMYLVLSLLCATINEYISGVVGLRANTLAAALTQLIDNKALKSLFDNHGLIDGAKVAASGGTQAPASGAALKDAVHPKDSAAPDKPAPSSLWQRLKRNDGPSYLSGRSVALALISSVDPNNQQPTFDEVEDAVKALPDSNIRDAMLASLLEADQKIDKLRDSLATWYDGAMDRLSGAYKRDLKYISLAVGFIIAAIFNADSLSVGTKLWQDRSLSQMIAQSAPGLMTAQCSGDKCKAAPAQAGAPATPNLDSVVTNFKTVQDNLRGFPIGWSGLVWPATAWAWLAFVFIKAFGLALTAAALMMGAPFWFDVLQKIMNFRAAGTKPPKTDAK